MGETRDKDYPIKLGPPPSRKDRERLFARIGEAASGFASLELTMDQCLWYLIDPSDETVGQAQLKTMNSFPKKVRLFKQRVLQKLNRAKPSDELKMLCDELKACSKKRDDILHSCYLPISGKPHELHQEWPKGRSRDKIVRGKKKAVDRGVSSVNEDELKSAIEAFQDAKLQLLSFMSENAYGQEAEHLPWEG